MGIVLDDKLFRDAWRHLAQPLIYFLTFKILGEMCRLVFSKHDFLRSSHGNMEVFFN